jgi:hypothetical protein
MALSHKGNWTASPGNYGPDDPGKLKAIVAQGKRIEERCRNEGRLDIIERAKEHTRR